MLRHRAYEDGQHEHAVGGIHAFVYPHDMWAGRSKLLVVVNFLFRLTSGRSLFAKCLDDMDQLPLSANPIRTTLLSRNFSGIAARTLILSQVEIRRSRMDARHNFRIGV